MSDESKKRKKKKFGPDMASLDSELIANTSFSNKSLVRLVTKLIAFAHYYGVKDSNPERALVCLAKVLAAGGVAKDLGKIGDGSMTMIGMVLDDDAKRKILGAAVASARYMLMTGDDQMVGLKSIVDLDIAIRTIMVYSTAFSKGVYKLDGAFDKSLVDEAQEAFTKIVNRVQGNRPDNYKMNLGDFERILMSTMRESLRIMKEEEDAKGETK